VVVVVVRCHFEAVVAVAIKVMYAKGALSPDEIC